MKNSLLKMLDIFLFPQARCWNSYRNICECQCALYNGSSDNKTSAGEAPQWALANNPRAAVLERIQIVTECALAVASNAHLFPSPTEQSSTPFEQRPFCNNSWYSSPDILNSNAETPQDLHPILRHRPLGRDSPRWEGYGGR